MERSKRQRRDVARPPLLPTQPALPQGPELYREPKDKGYKSPTDQPPPGFVGGTTSRTEWMVYHAMSKVMGAPEDPRQPPYYGAPGIWSYQKAWDEGRRAPGGAVIDFVVYSGSKSEHDIAFRVQTEYFHLYASADQQAHDVMQLERLSQYFRVVDLYDQDFAWDETNQATIIMLKEALAGNTFPNPINNGTTQRVSRI